MAAAAVVPSPSPFAALLRRSKFASYDPTIGQVYTTFGGDAHRGNYGLKRALALRKRGALVRISAVDSRHQQTEWKSGEKEAKWTQKFQEVGRRPEIAFESAGYNKAANSWSMDSEFSLASKDPASNLADDANLGIHVKNIASMTPKQFQKHLEHLRSLRPAFKAFIEETAQKQRENKSLRPLVQAKDSESPSLLKQSQYQTHLHKFFLNKEALKAIHNSESLAIEQQAHPNGALSYTHTPDLQHFFLKKALPGRAVDAIHSTSRGRGVVATFAGMTSELPTTQSEAIEPMQWKSLVEHGSTSDKGITDFRMSRAQVIRIPAVVGGEPQGLDALALRTIVSSHSTAKVDMTRPNPHMPWTREYNAHTSSEAQGDRARMSRYTEVPRKQVSFAPPPKDKNKKAAAGEGQQLIGKLFVMLSKNQK